MRKSIVWSMLLSQGIFFILLPVWLQLTTYLHPLVVVVIWLLIFILAFIIVFGVHNNKILVSKRTFHLFVLCYTIGLFVLLFFRPNGTNYGACNIIPFETIRLYLFGNASFLIAFYNLSANIVLFVPFGLYYRYVKKMASLTQLLFITVSSILTIEALQFLTRRGSFDVDDLLLNTLGVCLGYMILPIINKVLIIK